MLIACIVGVIYFSPADFMFWACIAICAAAIVVCMIPAPKDKHVMYAMQFFLEDFDKILNVRFGVVNMEKVVYIKGFKRSGKMMLKRYVDNKAVYPYPTMFAANRVHEDSFVYIGELSLMTAKEPRYTKCNTKDEGFEVSGEIDADNERIAYVTVKCKEYSEGITLVTENDFHYRSFLDIANGKGE